MAALAYADCQASGPRSHVPPIPELRSVPPHAGIASPVVDLDGRDLPVLRDESAITIAFAFPAGDPLHVQSVRPWLQAVLIAQWGEDAETALLALHEVIANGAVHGAGTVRVSVIIGDCELIADVWDECSLMPRRYAAGEGSESGRGLLIVEGLGGRLAATPSAGGKVVRLWMSRSRDMAADTDPLMLWGDDDV